MTDTQADANTETQAARVMNIVESYVTTVLRGYAYGLAGVFGARAHEASSALNDGFIHTVGWIGIITIFVLAVSLAFWALIRAERELQAELGLLVAGPMTALLFAATAAATYHGYGAFVKIADL